MTTQAELLKKIAGATLKRDTAATLFNNPFLAASYQHEICRAEEKLAALRISSPRASSPELTPPPPGSRPTPTARDPTATRFTIIRFSTARAISLIWNMQVRYRR